MLNSYLFLFILIAMQGPLPLPVDVELLGEALDWFRQGEAMIGTESEYTEAQARCFREAVKLSPDFEQARYNLVLVLLAQEKFQEAEEQSIQLLVRKPDFTQAYLLRAEARLKMGKSAAALEDLDVFIEKYPGDSRGLELRGKAFFNQGNFSEAAAAYERAGKGSEGSLESGIITGLSMLNSGKNQEAAYHFSGLAAAFPEAWESHYWSGVALRDLGRLEDAVTALQKAASLDTGNERVRKELVESYLERGDLKNAVIWINLKKNKTASDYVNLALLARAEQSLDDELDYLRVAAELAPRDTAILGELGEAQAESERTGEAIVTFHRILQINPADFAAHLRLAGLLLEQGDLEDSRELLERAVSLDPGSAEAHYRLGLVMDRLENFLRARQEYGKSLELGSQNPAAHFRLAYFLAEEGDGEGAMSHLATAVSGDPKRFVPLLVKETKNVHSRLESIRCTAPFSELINMYKDYWAEGEMKQD